MKHIYRSLFILCLTLFSLNIFALMTNKTFLSWSSGKDSALALDYLLRDPSYDVQCLLTNVNAVIDRVTMHGLRSELLYQQVDAIGIPLVEVKLPEMPSNTCYEQILELNISTLKRDGFSCAAFGDIFLEDLRQYREQQLNKLDVKGLFPLWRRDTTQLISEFIDLGYKAITICVNSKLLDETFAGRLIDRDFLNALPHNVDPCGENGEFHTFCFDGPIFNHPINFRIGDAIEREYAGHPSTKFIFLRSVNSLMMCHHETKHCPRCKVEFECKVGSISLCQCSGASLNDGERTFLASQFNDCLCIRCIRELQAEYHNCEHREKLDRLLRKS